MPGKKKKKKEGKAKGGGEGKLPPPPQLDDERQGAVEAFLKFKITGREEMVDLYQEEAEVFKEKNYHHKERNYQLKLQQEVHFKTLVESAKQYEDDQDKAEAVERDRVDEALTEKLELARRFESDLKDVAIRIREVESQLKAELEELDKWTFFKDTTDHRNKETIAMLKQKLKNMESEAVELKNDLEAKLERAKVEITKKSETFAKKQRELISSRLLESMDEASLGEINDNAWLRKQIEEAKKALQTIKSEVDALERRNLGLMETMTSIQLEEAEFTREMLQSSTRQGKVKTKSLGSSSELPSLVDVAKSTSNEGSGGHGQPGQVEMKLLTIQGASARFNLPPDTVHLPPIEEQRSAHTALPPRTKWPVSYSMLKSVV